MLPETQRRPMPTSPEVDAWFAEYDHPAKDAMERVRSIILEDDRMAEAIKWKSPTFMYQGNMASFNPRTKAHVSLMFHTGASIPGSHPRLEGGGDTARYMKFADLAEVEDAAGEIRAVVAAWCARNE
jgi:hypothetical protein